MPCNRELETAFTNYADRAPDVAAFAKNAGPQCLRIDYLAGGGRLAFYTPDFFVRASEEHYYLIETKGREDRDVPRKAAAAIAWCAAASVESCQWEYLYIPQGVFERHRGASIRELADTCRPALHNVLDTERIEERYPLFAATFAEEGEERPDIAGLGAKRRRQDHADARWTWPTQAQRRARGPLWGPCLERSADEPRPGWFRAAAL